MKISICTLLGTFDYENCEVDFYTPWVCVWKKSDETKGGILLPASAKREIVARFNENSVIQIKYGEGE